MSLRSTTRLVERATLLVAMVASFLASSASQISDKIIRVNVGQVNTGEPLSIQIELANSAAIDRVDLAYRSFGESEYKHVDMQIQGNVAAASIRPTDLSPPFLEYYFSLYLRGVAQPETYPLENPHEHPLKVDLQGAGAQGDEAIIALSPDRNEFVSSEDLVISFSLLHADSTTDRSI